MPVDPISPASALAATAPQHLVTRAPAAEDSGAGFGSVMGATVDGLQELKATSNQLATEAITGDLNDIHSAMIASSRSSVTFELVAAVRNKGVEAFNEIMRMQA